MKTWMKILFWFGLGGSIGYFAGVTFNDRKRDAELKDCCKECRNNCDNCDLMGVWKEIEEERKAEQTAEDIRNEYFGKEKKDTPEEEPEMPMEPPEIGDDEEIANAGRIEIISEQEFYTNSGGFPQEEMIWYREDQVLWNKDTRTKMTKEDIQKSIGKEVLGMIDNNQNSEAAFIKNNLIPALFRIDVFDAAFSEEHGDTSEVYDEEGDT